MMKMLISAVILIVVIAMIGFSILLALVWWNSLRNPPAYALIVEKFYVCRSHKALHGGIFGKGSTKMYFASGAQQWCWRWEWEEINLGEFRRLASDWYGVDWEEESHFLESAEREEN
ncbi:MAG: hypothetical protein CVV05_16070 [Gammaproteobacteria bacterium HGW-Gammaproteobacteria-1]|jgi:hypothetical protein|nr:MAG: hypothetical protein CVV05_16070 [Gammaproteobacteria bacterium HGW-Gammaproteobacteria-1]